MMFKSLKRKWNIESNVQLLIILIVFSINGSLTALISKPVIDWFGLTNEILPEWLLIPIRLILIFPVFLLMLVTIGTAFGQRKFFLQFAKQLVLRKKAKPKTN